jgi:hypothetical protein
VTAYLGPIRFNSYADGEAFRDWVEQAIGVDPRDLEYWEVQAHYEAYEAFCKDKLGEKDR